VRHRIESFEEVRADGHVISDDVTVDELLSRGLGIQPIVALRWRSGDVLVEYRAPSAVFGLRVPGGEFIAVHTGEDPSGADNRLSILNALGAEQANVSARVSFMGTEKLGFWSRLEHAWNSTEHVFGAVLSTKHDGDFLCDIDARSAEVLAVRRTR